MADGALNAILGEDGTVAEGQEGLAAQLVSQINTAIGSEVLTLEEKDAAQQILITVSKEYAQGASFEEIAAAIKKEMEEAFPELKQGGTADSHDISEKILTTVSNEYAQGASASDIQEAILNDLIAAFPELGEAGTAQQHAIAEKILTTISNEYAQGASAEDIQKAIQGDLEAAFPQLKAGFSIATYHDVAEQIMTTVSNQYADGASVSDIAQGILNDLIAAFPELREAGTAQQYDVARKLLTTISNAYAEGASVDNIVNIIAADIASAFPTAEEAQQHPVDWNTVAKIAMKYVGEDGTTPVDIEAFKKELTESGLLTEEQVNHTINYFVDTTGLDEAIDKINDLIAKEAIAQQEQLSLEQRYEQYAKQAEGLRKYQEATTQFLHAMDEGNLNAAQAAYDAMLEASDVIMASGNAAQEANEALALAAYNSTQDLVDWVYDFEDIPPEVKGIYQQMVDSYNEAGADMVGISGEVRDAAYQIAAAQAAAGNETAYAAQEVINALEGEAEAAGQVIERINGISLDQIKAEFDQFSIEAQNSADGFIETWANQEIINLFDTLAGTWQMDQADVRQVFLEYQEMLQGTLDDMIASASAAGVEIPDSLSEGLANNEISVSQAIDAIEALMTFDEAAAAASEAGLNIPDNLASSILAESGATTEAIAQINALVDFANAITAAHNEGTEITQEFANGLIEQSGLSGVINAGDVLGKSAVDATSKEAMLMTRVAHTACTEFSSAFINNKGAAEDAGKEYAEAVSNGVSGLPEDMNATGDSSGANLNNAFDSWSDTVYATVDDMYEIFQKALGTNLSTDMMKWGDKAGQEFNFGISSEKETILTTAEDITKEIKNTLEPFPKDMNDSGSSGGENFKTGLNNWIEPTAKVAAIMLKNIADALANLPTVLYDDGYYAGQGLYNGLVAWTDALYKLAGEIAANIKTTIADALEIESPSKVTERLGEFVGEGLAIGITTGGELAIDASENMVYDVIDAVSGVHYEYNPEEYQASGNDTYLEQIISLLDELRNLKVVMDSGEVVGVLAPELDHEFEQMRIRRGRG